MDSVEVTFQYATEEITDRFIEEADALLREMYTTTVASTDIPEYAFNWSKYRNAQHSNIVMLTTARYEEMLVGFALYLVVEHPHHVGTKIGECDAIAINVGLRKNGIGKQLIDFSLDMLRMAGAKFVTHRYRLCYGVEPIFPKLGFRLIEHVYMKDL
jgi:GNAT superfamily N-acetyltransferase